MRDVGVSAHQVRVNASATTDLPDGVYWFSEVDAPLVLIVGSGTRPADAATVDIGDLDDSQSLAQAYAWAEHYWTSGTDVQAPLFAIRQTVRTRVDGIDTAVDKREFEAGSWIYHVRIDGERRMLRENALASVEEDDEPEAWVERPPSSAARFGATLTRAKLTGRHSNTIFSFGSTRTVFRPYQFKPVLKMLQTGKQRILIADEVGLGKTIEAGLVWTELEARRAADRVLVVCPSALVPKWKHEMEDRFEFELQDFDTKTLDRFLRRHKEGSRPPRERFIGSLERLRTWGGMDELAEFPPDFDLVIFDEAHTMRNSGTKSNQLGMRVTEWADSLIMLSATPINLRQSDLANLLRILDPDDFDGLEDLELRLEPNAILHQVGESLLRPSLGARERQVTLDRIDRTTLGHALKRRPDYVSLRNVLGREPLQPEDIVEARAYLAELNALSGIVTRTRKAEIDENKAVRNAWTYRVNWTMQESDFYREYLEWCATRAKLVDMPMYFAMQMPLRLASACLPVARQTVLNYTGDLVIDDSDSDEDDDQRQPTVPPHRALLLAARALEDGVDSKFDMLLSAVRDLRQQGRQALAFTFSVPTLAYLRRRLQSAARVAVLSGRVDRDERQRIMAAFRDGAYDIVLANRVASEGLDFEFCSAVVNYDLPWNPMEIEQRIGRIDRIGQTEEKIVVANFYNDETIDERIMERVLDRIGIFESSIGELEPIITQNIRLLHEAFDFTLSQEEREHKANQALIAIESQKSSAKAVSDNAAGLLVANDVEVQGLEKDLRSTGRYVGHHELAALLADWAKTDAASEVSVAGDVLTIRGNVRMAERVQALVQTHERSSREVERIARDLRNESPIHLLLDQERSRTTGQPLLTPTHPLVLAAARIPGYRQERFAHLKVADPSDETPLGRFLVLLAVADWNVELGGREIWAEAIAHDGRTAPPSVAALVLAELARGELRDGSPAETTPDLIWQVGRARAGLQQRLQREQTRRTGEFLALRDSRMTRLNEQRLRRLASIGKSETTARERGRSKAAFQLFESQRAKAEQRYDALIEHERAKTAPEGSLAWLAACTVEVQ